MGQDTPPATFSCLSTLLPHSYLLTPSLSPSLCSCPAEPFGSFPLICHILGAYWVMQHSQWRKRICLGTRNIPGEHEVWGKSIMAHLPPQSIWPDWPTTLLVKTIPPVFPFCTIPFLLPLFCFRQEQKCLQLSKGPDWNFLSEITFSVWPK